MTDKPDSVPAWESLVRHILHADLDAFYAAVEQLDNPDLVGKPVMVGGNPENRGVVATASYEARKFGVHSAMPMRTAVRLCPQGIVVRPRFTRYREFSGRVMDIFRELTPLVEPLSLDEAYLDITEVVESEQRPSLGVSLDLKRRVREETGLAVSIGAATSKSVAKNRIGPAQTGRVGGGGAGDRGRVPGALGGGEAVRHWNPRRPTGCAARGSPPSDNWPASLGSGTSGSSARGQPAYRPRPWARTGKRSTPSVRPSR